MYKRQATYQVKFSVEDASDALRLGMTARAKIILEEKKGVFSVPLDTVGTSAEGGAVVYAKRTGADGSAVFEPIPVTTGMETDLAVEISGEGLEAVSYTHLDVYKRQVSDGEQ